MARPIADGKARPEAAAGFERLWAPWRSAYLTAADQRSKRCIFCFGRLGSKALRQRLVLHAGRLGVVMLNRYPYSSGHLLVAPRTHTGSPDLLEPEERHAIADLVAIAAANLRKAYKPAGLNIGANLGRAAGASFEHLHWHLVPRWEGDTNFMTVLSSTRVLGQALAETYALLEPLFKAIDPALA
ncbi:MAG: HIT domain-containing protein [Candidatus Binataceae bacterium]|jgi:ATP adenylyltransferase